MKLLFDQNLVRRLVAALADLFPGSVHVRDLGLASAPDESVWMHAASEGLVIVSKDSDFHQRSLLYGYPPKVIWIRSGNCTTEQIIELLRSHAEDLQTFASDREGSFLEIG
jgi:predicted nuclease of predicted toxin-antitoxin system